MIVFDQVMLVVPWWLKIAGRFHGLKGGKPFFLEGP